MTMKSKLTEAKLEVFRNRSVLHRPDADPEEFLEGKSSESAGRRLASIKHALSDGYLEKIILETKDPETAKPQLLPDQQQAIARLVNSVTSEVGRAVVGLTVLQLTIKAICPDQSIRLHKGGAGGAAFSWRDGLPMRVLDKNFCTPVLRKHNLLSLNADGVFMTRTLAENYPYSTLYKAAIRGGRDEWLELVDHIESRKIDAEAGLRALISMLINRSETFRKEATKALVNAAKVGRRLNSIRDAVRFLNGFIDASTYSARIFEIALHSFFQVIEEGKSLGGFLKPLSQMRSANKKHGNIGDVEVLARPDSFSIIETWDAKYGKPYLREELEELREKLMDHEETVVAGFVVNGLPDRKPEIANRIKEIRALTKVNVLIHSFEEWAVKNWKRASCSEQEFVRAWIEAFAECICQKRREKAPIDEPCDVWVKEFIKYSARTLAR